MRIGSPHQHEPGESRVALDPATAKRLTDAGHGVVIESGAGLGSGHRDDDYRDVGVEIGGAEAVWGCDFVATVESPSAELLRPGVSVLGFLSPFDHVERARTLAATGATLFAFEAIPRTTRAQSMDALSSQAAVAGYQAVLEAATRCDRFFPMLTTAAGTIRPAQVLVLGAGVAGLQAVATARRLGAVVSAFDVREAAAEQVESLGGRFVRVDMEPQDAATSGGYAREVSTDAQQRIIEGLAEHVAGADAVISTAAIPGRPAPRLIETATVARMRPGSVIVDAAAPTGGNCEATRPGEIVDLEGVTVLGPLDLPSRKANHASQMLARNVLSFLELVTGEGLELSIDRDDEIIAGSLIAVGGDLVHPRLNSEGA